MAYETGAPPPPEHTPITVETIQHRADDPLVPAVRPAAGYDATTAIAGLAGPPAGTTTYRLRGTETTGTTTGTTTETAETAETTD